MVENIDEKSINSIKDELIREKLNNETYGLKGKELTAAIQKWCRDRGIRRLKCYYYKTTIENMIPIKDKNGKAFKYFEGDSNAYIDIYADQKIEKWQGEVVSRFDANTPKGFIAEWQKNHPTAIKIMTLRINDTVKMNADDRGRGFYRVQKMSARGVTFAPIHEANVDSRNRNKEDDFKFITKSASALQKLKTHKVHISPTGLVREEK